LKDEKKLVVKTGLRRSSQAQDIGQARVMESLKKPILFRVTRVEVWRKIRLE
jgi:hypothetical protein